MMMDSEQNLNKFKYSILILVMLVGPDSLSYTTCLFILYVQSETEPTVLIPVGSVLKYLCFEIFRILKSLFVCNTLA